MSGMKSCLYAIPTDEGMIWCDKCDRQCRSKCKHFVSFPKTVLKEIKEKEYQRKLKEWLGK